MDNNITVNSSYAKFSQSINILILSAGRRVELIRFIKDTLNKNGIDGKISACDMSTTAPALFFSDKAFVVPPVLNPEYVDSIIDISKENHVNIIIPTIDTELLPLAERRDEIVKKTGALLNLSSRQTVKICRDKNKTAYFLNENGFYSPEIYTDSPKLPVFIKPRDGSSSINAHFIKTNIELEFYSQTVPNPIIQEYIDGEEFTVDTFSDFDATPITIVPRKRLAVRGGEILNGYITKDRQVIDECSKLIKKLELWGHNTIQCIKSDNKIYFIEINPRFGGGAPMSLRAGADSIMNLVRLYQGEKLIYVEDYASDIYCSRFDDSVFFDNTGNKIRL